MLKERKHSESEYTKLFQITVMLQILVFFVTYLRNSFLLYVHMPFSDSAQSFHFFKPETSLSNREYRTVLPWKLSQVLENIIQQRTHVLLHCFLMTLVLFPCPRKTVQDSGWHLLHPRFWKTVRR